MIHIELTQEEQEFLTFLLEGQLSDLHTEIDNTDRSDYKEMLKQRKKTLAQLLEKIQQLKTVKSS
jgi:hypothetical protein